MPDFPTFDDLRSQQDGRGGADDDADGGRPDTPRCVRDGCDGILTALLALPGGRVVREDSVPYSDGPAGVDGFVGCSVCRAPPRPAPDRSNPGGDGDDGGV